MHATATARSGWTTLTIRGMDVQAGDVIRMPANTAGLESRWRQVLEVTPQENGLFLDLRIADPVATKAQPARARRLTCLVEDFYAFDFVTVQAPVGTVGGQA